MWPLNDSSYNTLIRERYESLLPLLDSIDKKTLSEQQHEAYVNLKSNILDVINLYGVHTTTKYNEKKVKFITKCLEQNKKDLNNKVTVVMTTCKRYDLFVKTVDSFIEMCTDIDIYVSDVIVIDDQSSDEDIDKMRTNYPFLTIIRKDVKNKGHAKSMNMIVDLVKTQYFMILEDDWEFVSKDKYITKCLDVLSSNEKIGQTLINLNYAEDLNIGSTIRGSTRHFTSNNVAYYIHNFTGKNLYNYSNCHYWPHFSFRVGVTRTKILKEIGKFNETPIHFEMEYAHRYTNAGYVTAFLDCIAAYHTGRRTYERKNPTKTNAYELNKERQFGEELKEDEGRLIGSLNGKPLRIKQQYNIKASVINLEKRPSRLYKFMNQINVANYISIFNGVDGSKLKPNQKIQRLFESGDYNYRRGIIGCALSHITIWKEMLNNATLDYILIFEDDAILVDDFNTRLLHLINTYHGQFDVLYLGMFPYPNKDKNEWHYSNSVSESAPNNISKMPTIKRYTKSECFATSMGGNHGYLLNRKAVINLFEYLDTHGMTNAVDWMVMHTADINRICYSEPFIVEGDCYQTAGKTNYQTDIQLDYNSLSYSSDDEFFNDELKYWKDKYLDKVSLITDKNIKDIKIDDLVSQVTFIRRDKDTLNYLEDKPVKYYNVADWVVVVAECLLTKDIISDKTFGGYLNKTTFY